MHNCILCSEPLDENSHLYTCKNMVASAQNIPDLQELDSDRAMDLRLYQCPACGLIQFACAPVSYYKDAIRTCGRTMKELRRKQYRKFIDSCRLEGKKIIEVGCGQGEYLELLEDFPVEVYGIEHNAVLAEKARQKGLNVRSDFAGEKDQRLDGAPFDAFLSFNFLEHQPDPNGMVRCIYNNLCDGGYGLVTVPSWDYILENGSYYELLRDHIANYTEETLRFLFNKNGFTVLEIEVLNRDTLSMIVQKRPKANIANLKESCDRLSEQCSAFVNDRYERGLKVAVWGASHQGFTVVSSSGIGDRLSYIIDSAPFKQGKYSPGSHVPIVSPDHFLKEPVNSILIIAPAYVNEIAGIIRERFGSDVEIAAIRTNTIEWITNS